jgi:hypothetical protein
VGAAGCLQLFRLFACGLHLHAGPPGIDLVVCVGIPYRYTSHDPSPWPKRLKDGNGADCPAGLTSRKSQSAASPGRQQQICEGAQPEIFGRSGRPTLF